MAHYLLLALYTLVIAFLAQRIWKKTRSAFFMLGIFMLYYWSLLGAWFVVYDNLNDNAGMQFGLHYYYLLEEMFPVKADNAYMLANLLYAVFIIAIELTVLRFAGRRGAPQLPEKKLTLNHYTLLAGCFALMIVSLFIVRNEILYAASAGQSVYTITRGVANPLFPLHQLCNNLLVSGMFFGLVVYLSGPKGKYTFAKGTMPVTVLYILAAVLFEGYMLFLGNKKEIFFSGMASVLFFLYNINIRSSLVKISALCLIIMAPLFFNDAIRSYSPRFLLNYFDIPDLVYTPPPAVTYTQFSVQNASLTFLFSNEMFAAHFSMYGAVKYNVPLTYGKSVVVLAVSAIPRAIVPNRPEDVYQHYVKSVGASTHQGFTIHHATGWFINFWYTGVALGGFVLGWLWSWLYNLFCRPVTRKKFLFLVSVFGICAFSAGIPVLIRSGIEAYKVMAFELIILPCLFFYLSSYSIKNLVLLRFLKKQDERTRIKDQV